MPDSVTRFRDCAPSNVFLGTTVVGKRQRFRADLKIATRQGHIWAHCFFRVVRDENPCVQYGISSKSEIRLVSSAESVSGSCIIRLLCFEAGELYSMPD